MSILLWILYTLVAQAFFQH
jgi:hypothetical protein